jgi:hypothetical protein
MSLPTCSLKKRAGPKPRCKEPARQQPHPQQQQQQHQQKAPQQQLEHQQLQQQQQQQQYKLPPISALLHETRHCLDTAQHLLICPSFAELSRKRYAAVTAEQYGANTAVAARPYKRSRSDASLTLQSKHNSALYAVISIARSNSDSSSSSSSGSGSSSSSSSSSSTDFYSNSSSRALQRAVPLARHTRVEAVQHRLTAAELPPRCSSGSEAADTEHSAQLMCSIKRSNSTGSSCGGSDEDVRNSLKLLRCSSGESDSPQCSALSLLPGFDLGR